MNAPLAAIRFDTFSFFTKKKKKKTDTYATRRVRYASRLLYSPPLRRDDARVARLVSGAPALAPALAGAVPANRDAGARRDAREEDLVPL